MHNPKLVSVLIPTYNVELYIEEALNSILNQSYSNLEIIIIDDYSQDRTFEILQNISKKDKRIKLLRNEKNLKICKTLNKGLKISKGSYIVRMDGDDISELDRIEKQIEFLENNKDIHLVGTSVSNIDEKNKIFSKKKYYSDFEKLKKLSKYGTPVLHIWAARKEVYEVLEGYREIPYVEDYDFLLRMISRGYKFSNLEDYYGYKVRYRNGNTATSNGIQQIKAFEYVKKLFEERNKKKTDSFSEQNYFNAIQCLEKEKENYFKSQKKFQLFLKEKNRGKKLIFLLNSIFLSKYQLKKIIKRILFKFYGKFR